MPASITSQRQKALARQTAEQLLRRGVTRTNIALRTGLQRSTIDQIASRLKREKTTLQQRRNRLTDEQLAIYSQRCPGCGRKVLLPCLACECERQKKLPTMPSLPKGTFSHDMDRK